MPTILHVDGLRAYFYSNEHDPRHVHVTDGESEVVYDLNCPAGPLTVRDNYGFSKARVRRIAQDLRPQITALCEAWERHFDA